jgi:hypothetical protein
MSERHGPNFMKLVFNRAAILAVPSGGGLADGIEFLTNPDKRQRIMKEAFGFAEQAVEAMKAAPDNPYGDDEETICAAILAEAERRTHET